MRPVVGKSCQPASRALGRPPLIRPSVGPSLEGKAFFEAFPFFSYGFLQEGMRRRLNSVPRTRRECTGGISISSGCTPFCF